MAGKPYRATTTTTTFLAMSVLIVLAVLVRGAVTQEGIASSPNVSTPSPPPVTAAAAEDYESIDVNASSTSEATGGALATAGLHRKPGNAADVAAGCRGLRSKRYISDGFCRTLKPISEVLCTGYCIPERYMPWYPEFMQIWGRAKVMEYRCVDGVVRNQKIRLMCDNGKMRAYKVRVVKSCSCRKHLRSPSSSSSSSLQPVNRSPPHQLPSSASNGTALAAAATETKASKRHNRQRHHQGSKKRPEEPQKNA